MFSKLILYTFIILFIFILFNELSSQSSLIEGLTTDESSNDNDLGITVGRYTSKIDQLGKTVDSMQATILGLLPTVTKNAQDNAKNQQAIQAIERGDYLVDVTPANRQAIIDRLLVLKGIDVDKWKSNLAKKL